MEGEKERGRRGERQTGRAKGVERAREAFANIFNPCSFFFALLDSIPGMSPFHDFFVLTKMDADLDGDREWMEI